MDCFLTYLSAHLRAPEETLQVYAADINKRRGIREAFLGYGDIAQKEEKFRRFLAGLDPTLRAKCHEQRAADLEEALLITGRCEMARESLKMDYGHTDAPQVHVGKGVTAMVYFVSDGGDLLKMSDGEA